MPTRDATHPLTSVITRAVSEIAYLLQTEIQLARTELSEKLGKVANGGILVGAGTILALAGLIVLLLAIVQWLSIAGLPYEWGLLLVGAGVLLLGVGLLLKGTRNMKGTALVPHRTLAQLKADFSVVKEQMK
jgi:uncharacterized membrane protein YqjE